MIHNSFLFYLLLSILGGYFLITKYAYSEFLKWSTLLGLSFASFLGLFYQTNKSIAGAGFNEAVLFHLFYAQGDWRLLFTFPEIQQISLVFCIFSVLTIGIYYFFKKNTVKSLSMSFVAFLIAWGSVLLNPLWIDILNTADRLGLINPAGASKHSNVLDLSKHYVSVQDEKFTPPKNTIIIYAESLESALFDPSFGNVTEALKKLQKEAFVFDNIKQLDSSSWTMSGMIASQCGVPFSYLRHLNKVAYREFLRHHVCLGELLEKSGYVQRYYLGGANLSFSSKGDFYKESLFTDIMGREVLESEGYSVNEWGLFDTDLFKVASDKLSQREKSGAAEVPFAMVLLTLDTHTPEGYVDATCARANGYEKKEGLENHLMSLRCSTEAIARFIQQRLKIAKERGEEIRIILLSDHIMMSSPLEKMIKENGLPRSNILWIWDSEIMPGVSNRVGSSLDVAATIKSVMFGGSDSLGLGVSLFSNQKNLSEEYGFAKLNQSLWSWGEKESKGFVYEWLKDKKSE